LSVFVDDARSTTEDDDDDGVGLQPSLHDQNMVAAGSLFLLRPTASSCNCRHGSSNNVGQRATHLFGVESSSSSSRSLGPRQEDRIKSLLSDQSAKIEERADDGVSSLRFMGWEKTCFLLKRFQEREGRCNVTKMELSLESGWESGIGSRGWGSQIQRGESCLRRLALPVS